MDNQNTMYEEIGQDWVAVLILVLMDNQNTYKHDLVNERKAS